MLPWMSTQWPDMFFWPTLSTRHPPSRLTYSSNESSTLPRRVNLGLPQQRSFTVLWWTIRSRGNNGRVCPKEGIQQTYPQHPLIMRVQTCSNHGVFKGFSHVFPWFSENLEEFGGRDLPIKRQPSRLAADSACLVNTWPASICRGRHGPRWWAHDLIVSSIYTCYIYIIYICIRSCIIWGYIYIYIILII